ncbi:N-acetyltransferase domain-containing protein [Deinococcus saxicola]|uniref:GNAT family N-acetyltransferase n=1 Tax=Deinococcus saxicola TaxID=249406 RepID=UPI0039EE493E
MIEETLALAAPHDVQWGPFVCGDPQIEAKLQEEVRAAQRGLRALYEMRSGAELIAVFTLHVGTLQAGHGVLAALSPEAPLSIPSLHLPVIAVRTGHQGTGLGTRLMDFIMTLARNQAPNLGIKTLSLESTPTSDAFYTRLGFERSSQIWSDGSRARWLVLR